MKRGVSTRWMRLALLMAAGAAAGSAQAGVVYRCPGNPVLYTDSLSAKEAKDKGCRSLEGTPITIVQGFRPREAASGAAGGVNARIDPADQRARDSDAKRILSDELRREEDHLAALKQEYKDGQPDRLGDEKNYQKYIDRVAELKASIARSEGDIAALKREIAKTPQ